MTTNGMSVLFCRTMEIMADKMEFDTKLSPEGRVVIPAEVRRALDVSAGDRIRLVLDEGGVRLVSARTMAVSLWANNQGVDAGDSVADVRQFRAGDRALSDSRFEQSGETPADPRSDEEIADDLMVALGLET